MTRFDPTLSEMREFLTREFAAYADEWGAFDREGAIYWYAYHWHGGGGSNLYQALSTSPFNPGPLADGPEDGFESLMYDALEAEFAKVGQ